jgi:AcrR family transcriptional regulator
MSEPGEGRKERADAVRNRRAILAATEKLLATHRARDISMEQVAAEAGVGKGTIFHRFGSRTGLMTALMYERARELSDAITGGPPPLGPGAPDRDRLFAFLDAICEMIALNKSLLAELAHAGAPRAGAPRAGASGTGTSGEDGSGTGTSGARTAGLAEPGPEPGPDPDPDRAAGKPVYSFWHRHLSTLLAAGRPDVDAGLMAHIILGALHSEPVLERLAGDAADVSAALRALVQSLLDAG